MIGKSEHMHRDEDVNTAAPRQCPSERCTTARRISASTSATEEGTLGVDRMPPVCACDYKRIGNEAFARGDVALAKHMYSRAIAIDPLDSRLWSNRSAANVRLGNLAFATREARMAIVLDPCWPKAYWRYGKASLEYAKAEDSIVSAQEALTAFSDGVILSDGEDAELIAGWKEATEFAARLLVKLTSNTLGDGGAGCEVQQKIEEMALALHLAVEEGLQTCRNTKTKEELAARLQALRNGYRSPWLPPHRDLPELLPDDREGSRDRATGREVGLGDGAKTLGGCGESDSNGGDGGSDDGLEDMLRRVPGLRIMHVRELPAVGATDPRGAYEAAMSSAFGGGRGRMSASLISGGQGGAGDGVNRGDPSRRREGKEGERERGEEIDRDENERGENGDDEDEWYRFERPEPSGLSEEIPRAGEKAGANAKAGTRGTGADDGKEKEGADGACAGGDGCGGAAISASAEGSALDGSRELAGTPELREAGSHAFVSDNPRYDFKVTPPRPSISMADSERCREFFRRRCAGKKVRVSDTAHSGRGLFATHNIKTGDTILIEPPLVACNLGPQRVDDPDCWWCFRPYIYGDDPFVACDTCGALFCGRGCFDAALSVHVGVCGPRARGYAGLCRRLLKKGNASSKHIALIALIAGMVEPAIPPGGGPPKPVPVTEGPSARRTRPPTRTDRSATVPEGASGNGGSVGRDNGSTGGGDGGASDGVRRTGGRGRDNDAGRPGGRAAVGRDGVARSGKAVPSETGRGKTRRRRRDVRGVAAGATVGIGVGLGLGMGSGAGAGAGAGAGVVAQLPDLVLPSASRADAEGGDGTAVTPGDCCADAIAGPPRTRPPYSVERVGPYSRVDGESEQDMWERIEPGMFRNVAATDDLVKAYPLAHPILANLYCSPVLCERRDTLSCCFAYKAISEALGFPEAHWFGDEWYSVASTVVLPNASSYDTDPEGSASMPDVLKAAGRCMAIYALASMANHSCRPNAERSFHVPSHGNVAIMTAIAPIQAGEEITVLYTFEAHESHGDRAQRQALLEKWIGPCRCVACDEERNRSNRRSGRKSTPDRVRGGAVASTSVSNAEGPSVEKKQQRGGGRGGEGGGRGGGGGGKKLGRSGRR